MLRAAGKGRPIPGDLIVARVPVPAQPKRPVM
jgi:hypothetical protein